MLAIYVDSFLLPVDLIDDGILEARCEELWRNVITLSRSSL